MGTTPRYFIDERGWYFYNNPDMLNLEDERTMLGEVIECLVSWLERETIINCLNERRLLHNLKGNLTGTIRKKIEKMVVSSEDGVGTLSENLMSVNLCYLAFDKLSSLHLDLIAGLEPIGCATALDILQSCVREAANIYTLHVQIFSEPEYWAEANKTYIVKEDAFSSKQIEKYESLAGEQGRDDLVITVMHRITLCATGCTTSTEKITVLSHDFKQKAIDIIQKALKERENYTEKRRFLRALIWAFHSNRVLGGGFNCLLQVLLGILTHSFQTDTPALVSQSQPTKALLLMDRFLDLCICTGC
jgi:hypothetical protein